jgi:hypothetical protein
MSDTWRNVSRTVIDHALSTLPATATFADKKKAIDTAYPFGPRSHHPYKVWLSERKRYLARLSDKPAGPLLEPRA